MSALGEGGEMSLTESGHWTGRSWGEGTRGPVGQLCPLRLKRFQEIQVEMLRRQPDIWASMFAEPECVQTTCPLQDLSSEGTVGQQARSRGGT